MKKIIIALIALMPLVSNAGIYVEPYVGYGLLNVDSTTTVLGVKDNSSDDYKGTIYGGRLGASLLGFMVGADYSVTDADGDSLKDMGVFAGYQFPSIVPFLGKVWVSYFFDSKLEDLEGTGMTLGVGLAPIPLPIPFVSLHVNFEYRTHEWDDKGTGYTVDVEDTEYAVTVSLPMNF